MLRLFKLKNTQFNDEELFKRQLALVGESRRQKVEALIPRDKKNASLAAGVILPLALRACGYTGEIKLGYGEQGKPYLIQPQGLYFNVSHSGEYTVIAVSDGEVGCDIQCVRHVPPPTADRVFTEEEKQLFAAAIERGERQADELFCRIWTVKESYVKALGTGMSRPFSSFGVCFSQRGVAVLDPLSQESWNVSEVGGIEGYRVAVCARTGEKVTQIETVYAE